MERSVLSRRALFFKKSGKASRSSSNPTNGHQDIRLSFDTQRIQRAKSPEPVESILLNASYTQELSYQPTVPVRTKSIDPELQQGDTLANRIGRIDAFFNLCDGVNDRNSNFLNLVNTLNYPEVIALFTSSITFS